MRFLALFGFLIGAGGMVVYPRRRIKMGGNTSFRGTRNVNPESRAVTSGFRVRASRIPE
jgi:hypothetical protein